MSGGWSAGSRVTEMTLSLGKWAKGGLTEVGGVDVCACAWEHMCSCACAYMHVCTGMCLWACLEGTTQGESNGQATAGAKAGPQGRAGPV